MRIVFKTRYEQDIQLIKHAGHAFWYGALALVVLALPWVLTVAAPDTAKFYTGELSFVMIFAIAGIGLMLLTGYTGLVSLGHAAFLGVGAYAHAWFLKHGVPFVVSIPLAGVMASIVGVAFAIPALRMTGIYLAIASLVFAVIVEQVLINWESVTGGFAGFPVPNASLFGLDVSPFSSPTAFYYLCLAVLLLVLLAAINLLRSPTGRAMMAIRDSEISAQSIGINIAKYKTISFALSTGITGIAGALMAHKIGYLAPDAFNIIESIRLLLMIVIGGLGSLHGAIFGAVIVGLLPQALAIMRTEINELGSGVSEAGGAVEAAAAWLVSGIQDLVNSPGFEAGLFGLILVAIIVFEPLGLYGRWRKIRLYFDLFPLYRKATFKRQKAYLKTERMR